MQFPADAVIGSRLGCGEKAKVIANLPYHLTTPIIADIVKKRHLFSHLVLMVQDEVARRFSATPGTSEYSSFTVFLNFYSHSKYAFKVSNQCFYPKPKINSAIVVLELKEPPYVSDETAFFALTRTSFEQRRKMMRSSLRNLYASADVEAALTEIGHSPQARPEELSLDSFISLFEKLT
jgi:16S rRNA (adenine1518-N6/adenine1519-N6)-dimethyltransferase